MPSRARPPAQRCPNGRCFAEVADGHPFASSLRLRYCSPTSTMRATRASNGRELTPLCDVTARGSETPGILAH
jgi:hypothetical protein